MKYYIGFSNSFYSCICAVCFLSIHISFAQNTGDVEKRINALEERVDKLEKRLKMQAKADAKVKGENESLATDATKSVKSINYPVVAKLSNKKLHTAGIRNIEQNLALLIVFTNDGPKGISSFESELILRDATGDSILSIAVDIDNHIPPASKSSWYGGITYNSTDASHLKLMNLPTDSIRVETRLKRINFVDGTGKTVKK